MSEDDARREVARRRVTEKRSFRTHVLVYVVVNALLVVIWAVQGSEEFFPFWSIVGWGIGVAFHAWNVYMRRPITEADIVREMERSI